MLKIRQASLLLGVAFNKLTILVSVRSLLADILHPERFLFFPLIFRCIALRVQSSTPTKRLVVLFTSDKRYTLSSHTYTVIS